MPKTTSPNQQNTHIYGNWELFIFQNICPEYGHVMSNLNFNGFSSNFPEKAVTFFLSFW